MVGAVIVAFVVALGAEQGPPPVLRAGVSVEMAGSRNAVAVREADGAEAVVVAVTANGSVYLGTAPVVASELPKKMASVGLGAGRVFVKCDTRAKYVDVAKALGAVRKAGVQRIVLLTDQKDSRDTTASPVPPKGLEVAEGTDAPTTAAGGVVEVTVTGPGEEGRVEALLRKQRAGTANAVLRFDPQLPYGEVVRVVDACRGMGAKVFLVTATAPEVR